MTYLLIVYTLLVAAHANAASRHIPVYSYFTEYTTDYTPSSGVVAPHEVAARAATQLVEEFSSAHANFELKGTVKAIPQQGSIFTDTVECFYYKINPHGPLRGLDLSPNALWIFSYYSDDIGEPRHFPREWYSKEWVHKQLLSIAPDDAASFLAGNYWIILANSIFCPGSGEGATPVVSLNIMEPSAEQCDRDVAALKALIPSRRLSLCESVDSEEERVRSWLATTSLPSSEGSDEES